MKKTILMDKYPVFNLTIDKSECKYTTMQAIIEDLCAKIEAHPIAKFIAIFDHYAHTKNINGEIAPEILDAKNIVFCFGAAIPNSKILAVRPRSIGLCETKDQFVIDFLEAPKEELHALMETWAKSLVNACIKE
ncbi:DUF6858 family protein [Sulfurospirillum barnesii]|uniref:Uncharacterized protein n=1 Tax=Sulfurospirillum barnesii (strain ATCC 700032 / DSM 10660 / SES-3) TaxID=760154 RepID=I3XYR6_SULBS|nr:hypothetical protein [Sulfurospirillum barnesii]AFL69090.1 hypothetical protein Sulba_1809 [Sulfurospirillum barnesii SES-3]